MKTDAATQIRATRQQSNHALATHDVKSFSDSLAADFVMVRGNGGFVPSRQAYIDIFAADFKDPSAVRYERTPGQS